MRASRSSPPTRTRCRSRRARTRRRRARRRRRRRPHRPRRRRTMADIPAKLVMQLRSETGAPMMDCKRALQETDGDFDEAKRWLRERGMAQAAKRADRATSEGLVGYRVDGDKGTIAAVGCETEPVSKNDEFQAFAKKVLDTVENDGIEGAQALEEERVQLSGNLGENIVVAGAARFEPVDGAKIDGYAHPPANKLGV